MATREEVRHSIKNDLNAITTSAEVLRTVVSAEHRRMVEIILARTKAVGNQLSDLSEASGEGEGD